MKKDPRLRLGKMIYLGSFFVGFVLLLVFGKNIWDSNQLLNINALREIKNGVIEKSAFFQYILWRRLMLLSFAGFMWWKGLGKWFLYSTLGYLGISMGICMYTCLFRYHMKGLFLWFVLYIPQGLFYAAAMFGGMILMSEGRKEKQEKIKFLWQNWLIEFGVFAAYLLGIYSESYLNVSLLKSFLEFF